VAKPSIQTVIFVGATNLCPELPKPAQTLPMLLTMCCCKYTHKYLDGLMDEAPPPPLWTDADRHFMQLAFREV
jgi:hypothetical protein